MQEPTGRRKLFTMIVLTAVAVTTVLPFLWTLALSLKPADQVMSGGLIPKQITEQVEIDGKTHTVRLLRQLEDGRYRVKLLEGERKIVDVPGPVTVTERLDVRFDNYPKAWNAYPFLSFGRAYLNSLIVAVLVTLGQVFTCALAAYAFARLKFRGRDALFFCYLATMMVPGAVTMIPTFVLLKNMPDVLNWMFSTEFFAREFIGGGRMIGTDSYFALIAPRCFSAYGTFMLRQFFLSIPKELEEAAVLDGCGPLGVLRHVVLPLSKPAIATLSVFTFMWAWGDFFWPLVVTRSDSIKTLPLLLQTFQGQYGAQWNLLMAASVMGLLPMVGAFLLAQRHFIEGIKMGAVKG
ncbi:MAG: carbohydrate ABC transporter permease [Planctomycetes bacterium]|nr:carbohydrate ABC transporter permease [Planctomycetota bacterium]